MAGNTFNRVSAGLAGAAAAGLATFPSNVWLPGAESLDAIQPFNALAAFRPTVVALLLVIGVATLVVGRALLAKRHKLGIALMATSIGALAVLVLAGAQIGSRFIRHTQPLKPGEPTLSIVASNQKLSNGNIAQVAELAAAKQAGIVSLPETNQLHAEKLADKLQQLMPGRKFVAFSDLKGQGQDGDGALPTSLVVDQAYSPLKLIPPPDQDTHLGQVRAQLKVPGIGERVYVAAAHPVPPAFSPLDTNSGWRSENKMYAQLCDRGWIVAGDLNAAIDHSTVRRYTKTGCRSALVSAGKPLANTWGFGLPLMNTQIDHVMYPVGLETVDAGRRKITGSDHQAVWATLAVARQ